jgi:O-antigen chain-terminating methyltransferase
VSRVLETAREKNEGASSLPKFLRRFFRKQGGYNRAVLDGVAALAKSNDELTRRMADISVCLGQLNDWLVALHEQSDADAAWMKGAAPGFSRIAVLETEVHRAAAELESARFGLEELCRENKNDFEARQDLLAGRVEAVEAAMKTHTATLQDRLEQLRQQLEGVATAAAAGVEEQAQSLRHDLEHAGVHLRNLEAQTGELSRQLDELRTRHDHRTDELQHQIDHAGLHLRNLQAQTDRLGEHINNLQAFVDTKSAETDATRRAFEEELGEKTAVRQRIATLEERTVTDAALVKGELSEHTALFRRLLGEDLDEPVEPGRRRADTTESKIEAPPGMDSFYLALENRFRGPRAEIKKRVAFYIPFLRQCRAGTSGRPVLDLGCGRGEWLELLKEKKLDGRGVDLNAAMISQCKARRLKVHRGDVLEYLHSQRANSHGAVTGFHIIEHLPFETLMELFRHTRRVLKPGGVAIFESPNCKNLIVGACNFYIDPTHRHPIFPETAELMLASHGFEKIRIEYLSPVADASFDSSTPELAKMKDLLYGPQDFGIIAYKPAAR